MFGSTGAYIEDHLMSVLSANKGSISFGRTMAMLTTMFVLGWDTANLFFSWKFNHYLAEQHMPLLSLLPDPGTLIAQGGFMTLFYGVTKYGDIKTNNGDGSTTESVELETKK